MNKYIRFMVIAVLIMTGHNDTAFAKFLSDVPDKLVPSDGTTYIQALDGRKYRLYIPESTKDKKSPLLIVLHGAFGNAEWIEKALNMNPVADKRRFKVAYLDGTGRRAFRKKIRNMRFWNAGDCCGAAKRRNIDDVRYIDNVIKKIIKDNNINEKKVYLMGHSNGAMMSYKFACNKPEVIAALVAVSGQLMINKCNNSKGVRILHIHGNNDEQVPMRGGKGGLKGYTYKSIEQTKAEVEKSGATMEVRVLSGTGHKLAEINKTLKQKGEGGLADVIADFLKYSSPDLI